MAAERGWYNDPSGRHQYRFFDGGDWTANVADDGVAAIDPLPTRPPTGQPPERSPEAKSRWRSRGSLNDLLTRFGDIGSAHKEKVARGESTDLTSTEARSDSNESLGSSRIDSGSHSISSMEANTFTEPVNDKQKSNTESVGSRSFGAQSSNETPIARDDLVSDNSEPICESGGSRPRRYDFEHCSPG